MTARPLDHESRRRSEYAAVALMLVTVAVLLATGCLNQPPAASVNRTANGTAKVTPSILTMRVVETQRPSCGNVTPCIIINPIGSHHIGDIFEINGTTNLGIDEEIPVDIYGLPHSVPYPGVPGTTITVGLK